MTKEVLKDVTELATLGSGCFWCIEAIFQMVQGVKSVVSGYAGGQRPNPSYESVCTGTTGHAEVVQVTFDANVISYRDILEIFFGTHDPTTLNRQGADSGTQYRSTIMFHLKEQEETARLLIKELEEQGLFDDPIVTEVVPAPEFFAAEDYHQEYYRNNTTQGYCQAVISPKLVKFRERFAHRLAGQS